MDRMVFQVKVSRYRRLYYRHPHHLRLLRAVVQVDELAPGVPAE